jgi:acetylornithine deacetylase/succinyl-diaminopimelate desuccinylase-like protein
MNMPASPDSADSLLAQFIDRDFDRERDFLAALVRTRSDNPPGDCAPHAARTRELLSDMGFVVEEHRVPQAEVEAAGMLSVTNLIVRHRFAPAGPCIALNAHGDVVPPGTGWTHDPYGAAVINEPQQGPTMYGRGVAVSKSDFATYACALTALRELAAAGHRLRGSIELHLTYDEEIGGLLGPKWLLARALSRPDYAICAGFPYAVTSAHSGCLHLEVVVHGRQAHAAMPDAGADALAAATTILQGIYESRRYLRERRSSIPGISYPSLVVGLIEGGVNTNVVPDRVSFRIDRRIIPEESLERAEGQLRNLIERSVARHADVQVEVKRILAAQPLTRLAGAQRLTAALKRHGERFFGEPIKENGLPLYTDARHYASAGIPTVLYGAGPRTLAEARGHAADERLHLTDLRNATCTVACALAELLA